MLDINIFDNCLGRLFISIVSVNKNKGLKCFKMSHFEQKKIWDSNKSGEDNGSQKNTCCWQ